MRGPLSVCVMFLDRYLGARLRGYSVKDAHAHAMQGAIVVNANDAPGT